MFGKQPTTNGLTMRTINESRIKEETKIHRFQEEMESSRKLTEEFGFEKDFKEARD